MTFRDGVTAEEVVNQIIQTNFVMWCKDKERAIYESDKLAADILKALKAARVEGFKAGKVTGMTDEAVGCQEHSTKAFNDAIEQAARVAEKDAYGYATAEEIRKLKRGAALP